MAPHVGETAERQDLALCEVGCLLENEVLEREVEARRVRARAQRSIFFGPQRLSVTGGRRLTKGHRNFGSKFQVARLQACRARQGWYLTSSAKGNPPEPKDKLRQLQATCVKGRSTQSVLEESEVLNSLLTFKDNC